jgi:GNAT superfamily N-acetyltransferase
MGRAVAGGGDGIVKVRDAAQIAAVTGLVWDFFAFLKTRYPDMVAEIDGYVVEQGVAEKLAAFEAHYMPPAGECLLATHGGVAVGTVMLRPAGDGTGEVNRMYVADAARGLGLGRALCSAIIGEGRALGFTALTLAALDRHVEALPLYESLGFARYRPSGGSGADDPRFVFMRLDL